MFYLWQLRCGNSEAVGGSLSMVQGVFSVVCLYHMEVQWPIITVPIVVCWSCPYLWLTHKCVCLLNQLGLYLVLLWELVDEHITEFLGAFRNTSIFTVTMSLIFLTVLRLVQLPVSQMRNGALQRFCLAHDDWYLNPGFSKARASTHCLGCSSCFRDLASRNVRTRRDSVGWLLYHKDKGCFLWGAWR
jgi:hypothetical protein